MFCNTVMRAALLLIGIMFHSVPSNAAEPSSRSDSLSPTTPYSAERSDPVTHDVDFAIIVTPPYHCKVLKVWLPVPQSNRGQEITGSRFSAFPENVPPQIHTEPVYGNRFAYFEFHNPRGAQIIHHRFTAKVWNLHWNVSSENVTRLADWPKSFDPYLKTSRIGDENTFQDVLQEIVSERGESGVDLVKAMTWVNRNLAYDHVHASLRADANHALSERRGHCSDYHGLCAAFGRMLGYPTRVTDGLALYPKNSPSHCKMEAFLPPYGWVSFDLSETQKFIHAIQQDGELSDHEQESLVNAARERLHSGFRENSWLLMTKGTNYELVPPASGPVPVVRTAYIESDGEVLPDPDPANSRQREFSWMTSHRYSSDKPISEYSSLTGD